MAYFGNGNLRPLAEGQFTSSIYSLIRDHKFSEAIGHLQNELQVRAQILLIITVWNSAGWLLFFMELRHQFTQFLCRTSLIVGQHCRSWATATTTPDSSILQPRCKPECQALAKSTVADWPHDARNSSTDAVLPRLYAYEAGKHACSPD